MNPIKLEKNLGPVVFLGGMNAMPMMYAIELRKQGVEVLYFVDRPASDTLSRPENHFSDIQYPYPDWIVEFRLPTQIFLPIFRKIFAFFLHKKITKHTKKFPQAFVLNGFFGSLAPFLYGDISKVFLAAGSDFDSWADFDNSGALAKSFRKRSIFKIMPFFVAEGLIKKIVLRQFQGVCACEKTLYFPEGFNQAGDRVAEKVKRFGREVVPRYDVSFEPLKNLPRGVVGNDDKLNIFSGVRFLFESFPDGNAEYNKGNDIIIRGVADFYEKNKNIEVHFVEKGEDVIAAKALCKELGLESVVTWHKEMKFKELLSLYEKADVCFDQVGKHWIGAIGFYALWLGKPLIANDERAVKAGLWSSSAPILSAATAIEVSTHLEELKSPLVREDISRKSMHFAEANLGPEKALSAVFSGW